MAEENLENKEQGQEEKVQYSVEEVKALVEKVSELETKVESLTEALHVKQARKAKADMSRQAKVDAVIACAKYKVNKEEADKIAEEITTRYEEEFKKIQAEHEQKEAPIKEEHAKKEDEYKQLLVEEAEARKAYRQEKKTKEYKEFLAKNKKYEKMISEFEANKDIAPEDMKKNVEKLKEYADKNPLNPYAEELKRIEEKKKEVIAASKALEAKLKEQEENYGNVWEQLDTNKNKEIATANKDVVKPGFFQALSNFFTSPAKRKELAKKAAMEKGDETIQKLMESGGFDGKSIAGNKGKLKERISAWSEKKRREKMAKLVEMFEEINDSYQDKPGETKGDEVELPDATEVIRENGDDTSIVMPKVGEKQAAEKPETVANTAAKENDDDNDDHNR